MEIEITIRMLVSLINTYSFLFGTSDWNVNADLELHIQILGVDLDETIDKRSMFGLGSMSNR